MPLRDGYTLLMLEDRLRTEATCAWGPGVSRESCVNKNAHATAADILRLFFGEPHAHEFRCACGEVKK